MNGLCSQQKKVQMLFLFRFTETSLLILSLQTDYTDCCENQGKSNIYDYKYKIIKYVLKYITFKEYLSDHQLAHYNISGPLDSKQLKSVHLKGHQL